MKDNFMEGLINEASQSNWLGDYRVVNTLLRKWAKFIITHKNSTAELLDKAARKYAKVFLGQNKKYSGSAWFSPGQIDVHVGYRFGVDSVDPEEMVAGALLTMIEPLYDLAKSMKDVNSLPEQWQFQVSDLIQRYSYEFMGLPLSGFTSPDAEVKKTIPKNRLPRK